MWRPFLPALLVVGAACAYYNGLYNANRLADEARQAESQGRRGEARSLWLQAAVKADSVAARYPDSKYWDDALLMSGLAHSRVGECAAAVPPLSAAIVSSDEPALVMHARILLGSCQLELAQYDEVEGTVGPVADAENPRLAEQARTLRGRAALAKGDPEGALRDLEWTADTLARFDLADALIATDQLDFAVEVLVSTMRSEFNADRWSGVLERLGERDPNRAAFLVDEWAKTGVLHGNQMARLLIEDGNRWSQHGSVRRATNRFEESMLATDDTGLSDDARFRIAEVELQAAGDIGSVSDAAEAFADIPGSAAALYTDRLRRVMIAHRGSAGDELARFHTAELVRDSLAAPRLASELFLELVREHPRSAIAPKALLAVAFLRPEVADSIRRALTDQYPESPYTQLVTGGLGAGYAALEDSLRRVTTLAPPDTMQTRP